MLRIACFILIAVAISFPCRAQNDAEPVYNRLDPDPFDPAVDADIDLYMNHWERSMPRHTHGSLVERDILTACNGNPLAPAGPGEVLNYANHFSHASLNGFYTAGPVTLEHEQEVLYVLSGRGSLEHDGSETDMHPGVCVLIPPGIEFTLTNTGSEPLTMLLINEPAGEGFRPNDTILVRDEHTLPVTGHRVHWAMESKSLFGIDDGLATIQSVGVVEFPPNTIAQPHSHGQGVEEVWTALNEDANVLIGKQVRRQPPLTAFKVPPDGKTPHATINKTTGTLRYFFWARFDDRPPRD